MAHQAVSVVLVDDADDIRVLLTRGIQRHPDLDVVGEAGDFSAAVDVIASLQPDIALIDRSMPVSPSAEGIARLRERAPRTAIVLLSAYPAEAMEADLRDAADACLEKSMRLSELLDAVCAIARSRQS